MIAPQPPPTQRTTLACGDGVRSGNGAALVAALVAALGRRRLAAHERACPFQILLVGCSPVLSAHLVQRHTICRCGSCADEVCGSLSRESVKLRRAIDAIAASFCVRLRCATPCPRYACFDSVVLRASVACRDGSGTDSVQSPVLTFCVLLLASICCCAEPVSLRSLLLSSVYLFMCVDN